MAGSPLAFASASMAGHKMKRCTSAQIALSAPPTARPPRMPTRARPDDANMKNATGPMTSGNDNSEIQRFHDDTSDSSAPATNRSDAMTAWRGAPAANASAMAQIAMWASTT